MLELASSEQEGNGHSLRDTDFRRAAQGMCHKCSIGQQHSPEFPEPAWAIIVAEATYLCDQCQLQRVRQVCQKCPGVALLRCIVEQGELEVISDG